MDEHTELHAYNRVLLKTIKKEGTINIHNYMDESQNNYAEWKKLNKDYIIPYTESS